MSLRILTGVVLAFYVGNVQQMDCPGHNNGDVCSHRILQCFNLVAYPPKQRLTTGPKSATTTYSRFHAAGIIRENGIMTRPNLAVPMEPRIASFRLDLSRGKDKAGRNYLAR